jgi:hypothetical protein
VSLADYHAAIARKRIAFEPRGFSDISARDIPDGLFDHQKHGVEFGLRTGCSGLFYDTGLGKTAMELAWAQAVIRRTNRSVLMLAPLAVGAQHIREAERLGIEAVISRFGSAPSTPKIAVTNYERLERFDPADYAAVVLDESSIIKSFSGVTTRKLIATFKETPYRLEGSATPAPNDHTELGQHSEFLGVMPANHMQVRWFKHDTANTSVWRLKGHAVVPFWDWVASWARCVTKPSDLGYSDDGFVLPELRVHRHMVAADRSGDAGEEKRGKHFDPHSGMKQQRLFRMPDTSATSIHKEKRLTIDDRAALVATLIAAEPDEPWIIWCDTDYEEEALRAAIPSAFNVRGSMTIDVKEDRLQAFSSGQFKYLITKPKIAGFGLNWQHCARMVFAGLSFSYEAYYQAIRRCWRFRQERPVDCHVVCADTEAAIWDVVSRKAGDHDTMKAEMAAAMRRASATERVLMPYSPEQEARLPAWL